MMRTALIYCVCVAGVIAIAPACDSPTRERIDRWRGTVDGAKKLTAAAQSSDVAPELRARAAAHLVAMGDTDAAMLALGERPAADVVAALDAALWRDAAIASQLQVPTPGQVAAKDALFELRARASGAARDAIDGHLVDWMTGYYEGRAALGRHRGDAVVAAVGGRAAPGLRAELEHTLAEAAPAATRFVPVGDELLLGLALAGPPGIGTLLDVAERKLGDGHPDETLRGRAMGALRESYVERKQPAALLIPFLPRFEAIAADIKGPAASANAAFDLITATGSPSCLGPLSSLAGHADMNRAWVAVTQGLACAGADGVVPMAEALPPDREYDIDILEKYLFGAIAKLGPAAAPPARTLLSSASWLARWTGIRVLLLVGDASDATRIRTLETDAAPLRVGPGNDTKRAPSASVGQEARRVADKLEQKR